MIRPALGPPLLRLGGEEHRLEEKAALLPLAAEEAAIPLYGGLNAPQAQAVALSGRGEGQAVGAEAHRQGAGVAHRQGKAAVIGKLQLHLHPPLCLRQLLEGVEGVFQGVGKNHAKVHLVVGELGGELNLGFQPAACLLGLGKIGGEHRVNSGVGAPVGAGQVAELPLKLRDVLLNAGAVPL